MLKPIQKVRLISAKTPKLELNYDELKPSEIGWKAYGLASLPEQWTPPFLVVSSTYLIGDYSDADLLSLILDFFLTVGVSSDSRLYVRSNGTSETITDRGQLESRHCAFADVATTIRRLHSETSTDSKQDIHWIVQEYVPAVELGHLSNERHLKKENRDWVAEFEVSERQTTRDPVTIAIRKWRDDIRNPDLNLQCGSSFAITITLKNVAKWAMQYSFRIHFEWIWSGKRLFVVQAESEHTDQGTNPYALLPTKIASLEPTALRVFREAEEIDYSALGKLRNARIYRDLGYDMPAFFVASIAEHLDSIRNGNLPSEFEQDLEILTRRPLVIRTDGSNIPKEKREMLPRSDELRSKKEAAEWILTTFREKVDTGGLATYDLKFIAHQFIPSVASAWARAEPSQRIVRIESLWGIPEGLYYFAHDTFELDTRVSDIKTTPLGKRPGFGIKKRLRYKGRFIGPDAEGQWVPFETAPPDDWKPSIRRNNWLFEIAEMTRLVAELEGKAVSVMWFIDNHEDATKHRVLPWFHSESNIEGVKAASPRKKYSKSRHFELNTAEDWEMFKRRLASGEVIERVVLQPSDSNLIRNAEFAKELGALAKDHDIVVELMGGILSHAYYLLQRSGAKVEVRDLFGTEEDVAEFNKVVRDKIPEVIQSGGEEVETVTLSGNALVVALQKKLVEEALEALDAESGEALLGELADLEEVLMAVCSAINVSRDDLEHVRTEKVRKRGGFEKGLMLTKTFTPHSIPSHPAPVEMDEPALSGESSVISDPLLLPQKRPYRRPDLRTVEENPEKILTFESELTELSAGKQTLNFSIPIDGKAHNFVLTINLDRKNSRLRETISLRLEPVQLELEFDK